ncbi:hypothetical protein Oter_3461 [Opitutus terrae PB90-1]|uniref:Uncharacterized protein n=1 Tax=Opitutus terrae (strain DSM 11246 / JCM 15787 / PB90-1) TaxID=452637 RepID=B1ZV71_OPITP|nr:hypothetical protein Oter_3461 [Opitutus terrae PB90-1]
MVTDNHGLIRVNRCNPRLRIGKLDLDCHPRRALRLKLYALR